MGKNVLRINMDESSVAFTFLAHKGNTIASLRSRATSTQLVQQITRKEIRTAFTLVAFICDDPALHPRMSHIVLAPRRFVSSRYAPSIAQALPSNIYALVRKRAWLDLSIMFQTIRLLGDILEPLTHTVTLLLIIHTYTLHYA